MIDWFGRKKRARQRELWGKVASELGGTFHLPKGFWKPTNERIEATVNGVPLVLDTYVVSTGNSQVRYTRVAAKLVHGPVPKLQISRRGVLTGIGNVFSEDVTLGHADFDRELVVRCETPAIVRRLITERVMKLILATFLDAKLTCKNGALSLVTTGLWAEEKRLRDGIAIMTELAPRDIYGIEALLAVEGGGLQTDPRGWPFIEIAAASRVVIGAEDRDGHLVMVARASDARAGAENLELDVVDGVARDGERASRLPPGAHVALRSVGSGVLAVTGQDIQFRWRELELDPARLRAGADLLGAIAAGQQSAYR